MHPSVAPSGNLLAWPDFLVIGLYLAVNLGIGWWIMRGRRMNSGAYLLGRGKLPLWAMAVSWYATAVSSVSFMALPAYAYSKNWLQMMTGPMFTLSSLVVALGFIRIVRRLNTPTIYSYLELRFSREVRLVVAGLGILLSVLGRSSVIMVLPAMALSTATGLNVYLSLLLMGVVTTVYALEGGFEAVVWTDVLQASVMLLGVTLIVAYAASGVGGGLAGVIREADAADKFQFLSWEPTVSKPTAWVMMGVFLAGIFSTLSDQPLMQRVLAAKDERDGRRMVLIAVVLGFPSNAIFFFMGTAIFAFYQVNPDHLTPGLANDAIVGYFVVNELPTGLVGLIIAAIFAAAMSTFSSSLSAVAAVVTSDFLPVLRPRAEEGQKMRTGRWSTIFCGMLATGMALWVATLDVTSLWDQAVKLLALFGGAIPGVFALGMLTRRANSRGVIAGTVASIAVIIWIQAATDTTAFFQGFIALVTSMCVGYLASLTAGRGRDPQTLRGLTVWDLGSVVDARNVNDQQGTRCQ